MATVTIRLDENTRDRIAEAAEESGVTVSTYIRETLELHLRVDAPGDQDRPDTDESINLSMYERKIMQMLHRLNLAVHGDLDDSQYDEDSEKKMIKMLEGGYTADYSEEFADISTPMTRAECELVWDILDMFRVIGSSAKELGGWDQLGVEGAERYGTFRGFDLNDAEEARMLAYSRYLLESGRWTEQTEAFSRENDFGNSHSTLLPTYRAMLRVFKPLWRIAVRGWNRNLSAEDLKNVLLAAPGARPTED